MDGERSVCAARPREPVSADQYVAGMRPDALEQLRREEKIAVRDGGRTVRVDLARIRWIDAAGDYMCIHTTTETHILRATMRELEHQLDPRRFQRVHRSTIVNVDRVKAMRAHINGEYFLTLDCGHELKLSRTYRDKVEFFLKGAQAGKT